MFRTFIKYISIAILLLTMAIPATAQDTIRLVNKNVQTQCLGKSRISSLDFRLTPPDSLLPHYLHLSRLSSPDTLVCTSDTLHRREVLSIKTNLLFDFAYMPFGYDKFCPIPNVELEFYPKRGHFTFGAIFDCPWWQNYNAHKYFQIRNYELYTRFYFRSGNIRRRIPGQGAAFKGFFVSAYVHAGLYNICFGEKRGWEGEGAGGGLGLGYVLGLGKRQHWRLEFNAQFGYFYTGYDPYQWLCPVQPDIDPQQYYYKWYGKAEDFKKRQFRYGWLGPTRVEIKLSYDLLYRRIQKRGASFRNKERRQR